MSKAELTLPGLRNLGTPGHMGVGERGRLELSWQAWHSASFAQTGLYKHAMTIQTDLPSWQMSRGAGERSLRQSDPFLPLLQRHVGRALLARPFLGLFLRAGKLSFLPACLGLSLGPDRPRPTVQLQEPAAPTALGLLGLEFEGGRERRAEAPPQEVVLCLGLMAPQPPRARSAWCLDWLRAVSLSASLLGVSRAVFALARTLSHCLLWIFALIHCWNTVTFFEIQPLGASGHSYLTHPCPTPPHPTLLYSTLFSKKAFGSLGRLSAPKNLVSSSRLPFSPRRLKPRRSSHEPWTG